MDDRCRGTTEVHEDELDVNNGHTGGAYERQQSGAPISKTGLWKINLDRQMELSTTTRHRNEEPQCGHSV